MKIKFNSLGKSFISYFSSTLSISILFHGFAIFFIIFCSALTINSVNAAVSITFNNDPITNHELKTNDYDKRIAFIEPTFTYPTCANYDSNTKTITVTCNTDLSGIYNDLYNSTILEKDPNGVWILNASIKVNPQAKLTINNSDTSWLKITNKKADQPNFISISGSAKIDSVTITSWNPVAKNIIKENANGSIPRPYINSINAVGTVNISNSELAFLGYNLYPSNGFVYEKGGNGSSIVNNTFHHMWDGFYSNSAGFISIKNNKYHDNLRYGIDPHSGSHDISIIGNIAYNNGQIGIICSEKCYNILFDNNTVHDNLHAGLMFSLQTNNSTAKKNYAYNEQVGISVFSSSNNKVYDNLLKSNDKGIFIGGNSSYNRIFNNTLVNDKIGIDFADKPKNNMVKNNNIQNITSTMNLIR
jgi:mannuronan 5-epimerase